MEHDSQKLQQAARNRHGPAWRWILAQHAAARPASHPAGKHADKLRAQAAEYLRLHAEGELGPLRAANHDPEIHAAVALWENAALREPLEILALGDCPPAESAERLGVDQQVLETAEGLFFDVRACLTAPSWIVRCVILAEEHGGHEGRAARLRVAYFGGAVMARAIVDAGEGLPLARADQLFDESLLLHLKAQEALAFAIVSERTAMKYLDMHLDFLIREKRLDLEIAKFRHRCQRELACQKPADAPRSGAEEEKPTAASFRKKPARKPAQAA